MNMEKKNLTTQPNELTEKEYYYLFEDTRKPEMNKEPIANNDGNGNINVLPHYLPIRLHMMQEYYNNVQYLNNRMSNKKIVVVLGLVTRFPANHVKDSAYFKMILMIPMNTDSVKIQWAKTPLIPLPDVDQQSITVQGIETIENNIRTLTITNPYDVGTITTTFTTSKSSLYEQRRQEYQERHHHNREQSYYPRNNRYRDYGYGYGDNKKRRYDEK